MTVEQPEAPQTGMKMTIGKWMEAGVELTEFIDFKNLFDDEDIGIKLSWSTLLKLAKVIPEVDFHIDMSMKEGMKAIGAIIKQAFF